MNNLDVVKKFIGIPFENLGRSFKGCDCYGLVWLMYKEIKGIELPIAENIYGQAHRKQEVDEAIQHARENQVKYSIKSVFNEPLEFLDIMVFRRGNFEGHVGIYLAPHIMIHLVQGCHSIIERYDTSMWKTRHCETFRYVEDC